jgi:tetratricopeptide (TPR) repeat protein
MQIHPSDLLLKETFQDPASRHERLRDHLGGCSRCRKRLRDLLSAYWAGKPPDYDLVLNRSLAFLQRWQRMLTRERAEAPGLLTALLDHPVERQKLLLRNHPRFQTWGLFEHLLWHSLERVFVGAAESEDLARLALFLADHLDTAIYGSERIENLRARAWAYIGNSRRVRNDLVEADKAFETAFLHLRRGTEDLAERAALLELKASLRRVQLRFAEALRLLQRAVAVFLEAGDSHSAGRSMIKIETVYYRQGEPEKAILWVTQAIALIEPSREPRTLLCAWHNRIDDLAAAGRFMEAQGLLAKAHPLYRRFPEPSIQSRLKWVEGKISCGLGRYREARTLLRAAREQFFAANLPQYAALVSSEIRALPAR